jgi:predicted TIM-barrel fold metal-dependent hydrolase
MKIMKILKRKIIDAHVHAFADKIAERAVSAVLERMKKRGMNEVSLDGKLSSLLKSMEENGIDKSVVLPVATKPTQTDVLIEWAAGLPKDKFIAFGALHPENADYPEILKRVKNLGLKGVKMHPVFQSFRVNSVLAKDIFRICGELGLIATLHAGMDLYENPDADASPKAIAEALEENPGVTFVAAHMGGRQQWDEAEKYLFGKNLYLDTSLAPTFIEPSEFVKMVRRHGADKVLFGTDSPWRGQGEAVRYIENCGLTEEEKGLIFYKNAEKLFAGAVN